MGLLRLEGDAVRPKQVLNAPCLAGLRILCAGSRAPRIGGSSGQWRSALVLIDSTESGYGVNQKRVPTMIEMLVPIWQRVLQRSSLRIDDNFFDLGGSLRSADILFAEIARACGRELPSAMIYHAPTIAALARLLEQPTLPRFSPFVQIKAGDQQSPILIVHGLAGTLPFYGLAQHIRTGHSIYGIQGKGVDGMEEPLESVEDMAAFYLDSIQDVQPHGPYILIGYSFGGLVALEMAQRLTKSGEEVALLVLIDAYPHLRYLSPGQRLRLIGRRALRRTGMKQRLARAASYLTPRLGGLRNRGNRLAEASRLSFEETALRVKEKAYVALAHYRPLFYDGKVKFVKSESDSYYPSDPVAVWVKLAAEFEFETVPGGHLDMVTTDFEGLAAVLTRYVKETLSQELGGLESIGQIRG
jgi:acetoacetyl-CoA synthetase